MKFSDFSFLPLNFEETPGKHLGAWQVVLLLHTVKLGYSPIILPQMPMDAVKTWDGGSFVKSWISLLVNALELVTGINGHAASNILNGNYEVCGFSVRKNLTHRKRENKQTNKKLLSTVLYFVLQTAEEGARNVTISTSRLLVQNCLVNFDEDSGKKKMCVCVCVCVCVAMYNTTPHPTVTHTYLNKGKLSEWKWREKHIFSHRNW